MTETDFRELLKNFDHLFRVTKIGSTGKTWVAAGKLLEGRTENEVRHHLNDLDVEADVRHEDGIVWVQVSERPIQKRDSDSVVVIPTINIILLLLTVVTTLLAGSILQGGNPLAHLSDLVKGIPYSIVLLLILGSHEFGHYYYARKNRVDATLPYFIPAPPFILLIGTFGAFIRIKSPIRSRKALLEIGAAGPIAGFVVSFAAILIGYSLIPDQQAVLAHVASAHNVAGIEANESTVVQLSMGTSVLFKALGAIYRVEVPMDEIYHFPFIFAGWIGFLVTMLNLLPIGQLDGGHIAYALLGEKHNRWAKWVFLLLIPLGFISAHWWVWAVLVLVLMRSWKHPPIFDMGSPVTRRENLIGLICLMILISCFIPIPVTIS
ncbi:MAG: site-2 protease family protein [Candidatus Neomarinimicrobiota bacterium]